MQVKFSREFRKEYLKQSGKVRKSLLQVIKEVIRTKTLEDITNCRKITGLKNIYRIRTGDLRAFFTFHIMAKDGQVYFIALLHRGQAYDKKIMKKLKESDAGQAPERSSHEPHSKQH
jgi:mRNA-degrading endonuclease RelE of RelBE toxin-antitoxin system